MLIGYFCKTSKHACLNSCRAGGIFKGVLGTVSGLWAQNHFFTKSELSYAHYEHKASLCLQILNNFSKIVVSYYIAITCTHEYSIIGTRVFYKANLIPSVCFCLDLIRKLASGQISWLYKFRIFLQFFAIFLCNFSQCTVRFCNFFLQIFSH